MNSVMTKRLSIAYAQYLSMGLHLFNKMDWSTYAKYRYVLDNGYIFVAMRYGLAFLPFYWVVHFFAARKNKYLPVVLVALTVISLTNFIDNDLLSYGYLPIILLAFNRSSLEETSERLSEEPLTAVEVTGGGSDGQID